MVRKRLGLVGCVKSKQARPAPAAVLYTSALFRGRRRWVEATCDEWYVLSALHGLVRPDQVVEPYDATLNNLGRRERREWAARVLRQLDEAIGDWPDQIVELHAGANYADFGLVDGIRRRGTEVIEPAKGLAQGQQLALYKRGPVNQL